MKDLIKKILKESEDDLDWARDIINSMPKIGDIFNTNTEANILVKIVDIVCVEGYKPKSRIYHTISGGSIKVELYGCRIHFDESRDKGKTWSEGFGTELEWLNILINRGWWTKVNNNLSESEDEIELAKIIITEPIDLWNIFKNSNFSKTSDLYNLKVKLTPKDDEYFTISLSNCGENPPGWWYNNAFNIIQWGYKTKEYIDCGACHGKVYLDDCDDKVFGVVLKHNTMDYDYWVSEEMVNLVLTNEDIIKESEENSLEWVEDIIKNMPLDIGNVFYIVDNGADYGEIFPDNYRPKNVRYVFYVSEIINRGEELFIKTPLCNPNKVTYNKKDYHEVSVRCSWGDDEDREYISYQNAIKLIDSKYWRPMK